MGGGNGQKAKMTREKNLEEQKAASKGGQLESKKKATSIQAVNSRSLDYSHFVSLPLATNPLSDKLIDFQKAILGNSDASSDMRIDKSIFIKPETFHLTVLMLKLWNKERVDAASEVLKNVSSKVMDALDNRSISIKLKGLACMTDSLDKARVIYAPVEEIGSEGRLLRACQVIIDAFVEAGLVLDGDVHKSKRLKLHATVMNARHRKGNGEKDRGKKLDSFDARGILDEFKSEEWGEYLIREAHLSQRFVYDKNGYYHCCAWIPFPDSNQLEKFCGCVIS